METVKLNIEDCEKIRRIGGELPYKNTKENSRYEGKNYFTYVCDGKVFTVETEEKFNKDFEADNLFEVSLEKREMEDGREGFSFLSHRSIARAMATHKTNVMMKAFTVEFVQSQQTLSPEELATI